MDERRLVYSTDGDLPLPVPGRAKAPPRPGHAQLPDDGIIRVGRERRRAGVVTIVHGLPASELTEAGKALRRSCGTGGTAKGGVLELQGDHRDRVAAHFETQGRRVKRIGG
ncbi:MAG TPA: translation initiation factor [Candidatus Binatia bacterium]|nr:translation initiation factor [Candidatus Binatia bacterium]